MGALLPGLTLLWFLLLFGGPPASRAEAAERLLTVERLFDVTYARHGDRELKADVYVPAGPGPYPGVLMVHGGAWMAGDKRNMRSAAQLVASHGYTVASINYRLAPIDKFPAQVEDCKAAVRWLRDKADVYKLDPRRVAGYGYSAGGHLVCMLGTTGPDDGFDALRDEQPSDPAAGIRAAGTPAAGTPAAGTPAAAKPAAGSETAGAPAAGTRANRDTRLQAVVAGGAPCDFQQIPLDAIWLTYFLGGTRREVPQTYRRASPTTFVTADDPPVFFFHGEADRLVPLESSKALQKRLAAAGVATEFYEVAGKGHLGAFLSEDPVRRAIVFLDRHLKDAR